MSNDLRILDLHEKDNTDDGNPEQYAINVLGEESLKTAKALVKKSEQVIKAAAAPEAKKPKRYQYKGRRIADDFAAPSDYGVTSAPAQDIPDSALPKGATTDIPREEKRTNAESTKKGRSVPIRNRKTTPPPSPSNSIPVRHSAEIPLHTWQGEPPTYQLQNQGLGLVLAENPGAGLQATQATGTAVTNGGAAAATVAGPAAVAYQAAEKAVTKIKETAENSAVRAQTSQKKLGALAALFLVPVLILLGIAGALQGGGFASNVNLSADVLALMPQINAACQANGIPEYAALAAAVMMQESGGNVEAVHGDVMQCAESMGYPAGTPVPVNESINHGVSLLAHKLSTAGATGPTDIPAISLALQAYNYGDGYFNWARSHGGGYSKENALSFQQYQMSHGFPGGYGDANYVDHVLRYYQVGAGGMGAGSAIANGAFAYPCAGYGWKTYAGHEGIDIPMNVGEPVYACAAGTVTYVQSAWHSGMGYDGLASYGNCVFVDHGSGWQSRYAHMSSAAVASGTVVQQGQLIGYVGSTGNSTGPHLHLALYCNGSPSSGGVIYAEQAWPQYRR